jgi:hypothetical protein
MSKHLIRRGASALVVWVTLLAAQPADAQRLNFP